MYLRASFHQNNLKMRYFFLLSILFSIVACTPKTQAVVEELNTVNSMDTLSYSLGVLVAQNLKDQGFEGLVADDLAIAINDVLNDSTLQVDINQCNMNVQQYMAEKAKKASAGNIEAGQTFLAENGARPEVTTTASGLQYEILETGDGPKPKATDKVTVHYHGTLINGKVFDSSVKRGQPATFPVNGVIQGWVEALQLMPEGSKWRLFIPYDLAYGERGAGGDIGPFETLIFDVELLKIN